MAPPVAKHDSDEGDMILLKDMIWMRDRVRRVLWESTLACLRARVGDNDTDIDYRRVSNFLPDA